MKRSDLKGKRVTVFGLGLNDGGVGTVEFLERSGVREIIVTDVKKREDLTPSLKRLSSYKNITYVLGAHRPEDFTRTDLVVKNPVIPWTNEYVRLAEKHGVPVEMDSSLFFELVKNPVIGITGTRGKTTTASLIVHIFETARKPVSRVGISRTPVLGAVDRIKPEDTVVFELSSWRLSALGRKKMSPSIAVVTNIYPDHLNYYKTMEAYIRDKEYIFSAQKKNGKVILNARNDITRSMAERVSGEVLFFSSDGPVENGIFYRDGSAVFVRDGKEEKLFKKSDVKMMGAHNLDNALAAALAARIAGIGPEAIRNGIRTFSGIPHRLELVAEKKGVSYYNDTAATSPDGAIAGLRAFDGKKVILIAGGANKNLDFSAFAGEILNRTKGAVFFRGDATESLLRKLCEIVPGEKRSCDFETVDTMEKAVDIAARSAEPGDIVLLSPGAASFGLFRNEFDRGNSFKEAVKALPEK